MKRLLSGVKPTGNIHIGNYFGALKQFVDLQDNYECFIFIADLHALNQIKNPTELFNLTLETAKTYISVGLNPEKVLLYKQSDVPIVTELTWIFNTLTPVSLMQRSHAYKDAISKSQTPSMGLFDYPVLMAADILLYDADIVPVGKDQEQHLEITRDIATFFNNTYSDTFKLPETKLTGDTSVVTGLDGLKMSKSYNNTIGLFDNEDEIKRKIMSIVTDSKGANEVKDPETCNIYALHKLFSNNEIDVIRSKYLEGKISYKESKEILFKNLLTYLKPIRERKLELDQNPKIVTELLEKNKKIVSKIAEEKIRLVRRKVGIDL